MGRLKLEEYLPKESRGAITIMKAFKSAKIKLKAFFIKKKPKLIKKVKIIKIKISNYYFLFSIF